jgi:autotransporter-associated beta strand protein
MISKVQTSLGDSADSAPRPGLFKVGLLLASTLAPVLMAPSAQAACTVTPTQPITGITTPLTAVSCTGANTGQTITANTDGVEVTVSGSGSTLNNSVVSLFGDANSLTILGGTSAANLLYTNTGPLGSLWIGGTVTNLTTSINGLQNNIDIISTGVVTAAPSNIVLAAGAGQLQRFRLDGSLTSTGNSGGAYLITGGTGNQRFDIFGTLTVQPDGFAIDAGDGDDIILIGPTATVNGGTGNNITFNGGAGSDIFNIQGGGARAFNTLGIEELILSPGVGNTLTLGGTGAYSRVQVQAGTTEVSSLAALGQTTSELRIGNNARLRLNLTSGATFSNTLLSVGTLEQMGQTITYNGAASSAGPFNGTFQISGGRAILASSAQFGNANIINNAALEFDSVTLANTISGTGTVTKTGGGVGVLSGNNSYAGGTDIDGGTLRIRNGGAAGTGAVTITGGASLELNFATDQTFANNITGAGGLIKTDLGIATLTGTNTFSGGTNLLGGGIRVSDLSQLGSGPITSAADTQLIYNYTGGAPQILTAPIFTGGGVFVKEGAGELQFNAANSYTGGTWVRGGVLRFGVNNAFGTGDILIDSGATLALGSGGASPAVNNNISGSGTIVIDQNAGAELYGNNSGFTGTLNVADPAGYLYVQNGAALGNGTVNLSGGPTSLLQVDNAADTTVAANLTGIGYVEKSGAGRLTLTGAGSLSGGPIIVYDGTLQIAGSGNIGVGPVIDLFTGTTLELSTNTNTTLANSVIRDGRIVKTGTGTTTLSGLNTYTGGTDILQGALRINALTALGSGPVSVASGAFLDFNVASSATWNAAITGAGRLRKSGAGDLTLVSNTLTGGLDIQSGRVIVSTPTATGGPVTTALGAGLVFNIAAGPNVASSVSISGAGQVIKEGAGDLVITNTNTYTGGTFINAGRLGLNVGDGLGSGTVNIGANGVLGLGGVTFNNFIAGAGSILKTGSGEAIVSNASTFTGGAVVQDGSIRITQGAGLGTGQVSLASGTFLTLDHASGQTTANVISGAGQVRKAGVGVTTLTGASTYTGGTAVNAGRLHVASGATAGTGGVTVASGAQFSFEAGTLANAISGAGLVAKTGASAATLTGANTHTGGTLVAGGTLNVSTLGALGTGGVQVDSGATLALANTGTTIFSNGLSGAGALRLSGTGQMTFGSNFGIGSVLIDSARMRLNAIGQGAFTVGANGALDGTGRIIGNLTNNGRVAPGNSIGTLTVQGNYVHNANSVLEIEFDANGGIDLLNVTGTATLNGGTLRFVSIGAAEGTGGTFLQASGGVSGTFSTIETVGALLPLSVVYQTNSAIMAPSILSARPSTFNAQILAAGDTGLAFVNQAALQAFASPETGSQAWASGFAAAGARNASGATLGYDHDSLGVAGGYTFAASPKWAAGVGLGLTASDISLENDGGDGEQDGVLGVAYARYAGERVQFSGGVLAGSVDQSAVRNVRFNGFAASVAGETSSSLYGVFAAVQAPIGQAAGWDFGLGARATALRQSQDGYTEKGTSPLRLTVAELDVDTREAQAGFTAARVLGGAEKGVRVQFGAGARYLDAEAVDIPVTFAGSNAGVTLESDARDTLHGYVEAGSEYTLDNGVTLRAGYSGQIGETSRHEARVGLNLRF